MNIFNFGKKDELPENIKSVVNFVAEIENDVLEFSDGDPLTIYTLDDASQIYSSGLGFILPNARGINIRLSTLTGNQDSRITEDLSKGRKNIFLSSTVGDDIEEYVSDMVEEVDFDLRGAALLTIFPEPNMKYILRKNSLSDFLNTTYEIPEKYSDISDEYARLLTRAERILDYPGDWNEEKEHAFNEVSAEMYGITLEEPDEKDALETLWTPVWERSREIRGNYKNNNIKR